MLEQKDLQAIDEIIQKRIGESEERTNQRFEEMQAQMDRRFEAVDNRFEAIDKRLDTMDARFDAMDNRLDAMDMRFDAMDNRLDEMKGDIWQSVSVMMDAKFDKLFHLLAENQQILQEKMDRILGEKLPERVEKTEGDVQVLKVAVRHLNQDVEELRAAK
ncbi:MAG: hypothetical protein HFE99_10605 [Ruminiclostridium sp.]|jgi:chaperonin cofactor prefoldin|nr:hypothetical protein [Ruminiclostridium sp.]